MKSNTGFLYRVPLYPVLLGIYPVLFLWMANYIQIPAFAVPSTFLFCVGITLVVCLLSLLIFRNLPKAGAAAGLVLALFFFYGHFLDLVAKWTVFGISIGRNRYVLVLWGILLVVGLIAIIRSKSSLANLTWIANLVLSFLVLLTLVQIGYAFLSNQWMLAKPTASAIQSATSLPGSDANTPDVYYIVSDGFNRQDLLKKDQNLDDQAFISQLETLGFVIPNCTQSNYYHTVISMAATLNMNYLDTLGFASTYLAKGEFWYTTSLAPALIDNLVMQKFKAAGYKIITLKSEWPFLDFKNSDLIIDAENQASNLHKVESTNFLSLFWRTTLARVAIEEAVSSTDSSNSLPAFLVRPFDPITSENAADNTSQEYQQNLYQLNSLSLLPQIVGKKFLYAHLLSTHAPFTFTATGGYLGNVPESNQTYAEQVEYTSQRLLSLVKTLITQSRVPPIIILQADHAYTNDNPDDAFKILNAYYLPGGGSKLLYPQITPVNTFRLIFSYYFHQDYPLLPDKSIFFDPQYPDGSKIFPQTCVQ
jgi:hypothetical protein